MSISQGFWLRTLAKEIIGRIMEGGGVGGYRINERLENQSGN